ncbi:MAG: hypothetical protein AABX58_01015 [Thermoproteota archaeon]|jgi:hypothetical protein
MIVKTGDKIVHQLNNGEGILYEVVEDLINPLRIIKTLSKNEVNSHK